MELSLSNVINVSVSESGAGAGEYNTSNLAIFTDEIPEASFGDGEYAIYLSPTQVGVDFGTDSVTYAMANAIFMQRPNILANSGYLVVIKKGNNPRTMTISIPSAASGQASVSASSGGLMTTLIFGDSAATTQTRLRNLQGFENVVVTGGVVGSEDIVVSLVDVPDGVTLNIDSEEFLDSESAPVPMTISYVAGTETTLGAAITRTQDLVQYFGVISTKVETESDMLAAAAVIQPLNKMAFFVSRTAADVEVGGKLDLLRTNGYSQSRGIYYGAGSDTNALVMAAAYASRALSTNFSGSKTTQTMHLKDLTGVTADPAMTQTLLAKCQAAGADTYVSLQGVAKVFSSGKNQFFDHVYNTLWFVGAIKIAGFNVLAQTSSKIAQTEKGMDALKGAYRKVCEQAVRNEFAAPGSWTSPDSFGVQEDFHANIEQRGYYIYSLPVSQQSATDRDARKAPLCQIAIKSAGAMHSAGVIVNVNK